MYKTSLRFRINAEYLEDVQNMVIWRLNLALSKDIYLYNGSIDKNVLLNLNITSNKEIVTKKSISESTKKSIVYICTQIFSNNMESKEKIKWKHILLYFMSFDQDGFKLYKGFVKMICYITALQRREYTRFPFIFSHSDSVITRKDRKTSYMKIHRFPLLSLERNNGHRKVGKN